MENEYREIDIKEIFYLIKMRWWIIAICFTVATVTVGIYSYFIVDPVYRAEALLFVGREPQEKSDAYNLSELQVNQKLVMDYREIIKSRLAAKDVINNLELKMSPDDLRGRITVTTVNDSRMFKISMEHTNAQLAADVVNKMSEVIIDQAYEIMDVENVRVVDAAEKSMIPVKPNKRMNVAIAAILGIAVGGGIIFALEFLNNTIKNASDVMRYLDLTIMGEIPEFEGEGRKYKSGKKRRSKKTQS